MSSYPHANRVLDRRSLVFPSKTAGDSVNAERSTKPVAAKVAEESDGGVAVLTLDDFGGRSDALGG
jgi:hypothetical protein